MASIDTTSLITSTASTSFGLSPEDERRVREAAEDSETPEAEPTSASVEEGSIRDRLLGEIDREPFDFGRHRVGRRVSINFTDMEGVGGSEDKDDVVGDFREGRGYDLPSPDAETICRLFGVRVWESERHNLRKLLRFTPDLSDSPNDAEADFTYRWCVEVATSISRMKKACNFRNDKNIDRELNTEYFGINGSDVFVFGVAPGRAFTGAIGSLYANRVREGGWDQPPLPFVWFRSGESAVLKRGYHTPAMLEVYGDSTWRATSDKHYFREAFKFQVATSGADTDYGRVKMGGRLTVDMLRRYAARYAALPLQDAVQICFMAWLRDNFGVAVPGGIPRMSKYDAVKFRVKWNKIKRVPPNAKNVNKSRIERDLGDFGTQNSAVLDETLRPADLETLLRQRRREALSASRSGKDRADRVLRQIEEALASFGSLSALPEEVQSYARALQEILRAARRLDVETPQGAAEFLSTVAEATGELAVVGDFVTQLEGVAAEVREFGEEMMATAEAAFADAVEMVVADIAVQVGLDLAISVTIAGALSTLLGSAFEGIVEKVISGVLEALGFKEGEPPPPEVVPYTFDPPLERWPSMEANVDFERPVATSVILRDFMDFMQDTQRVFAGNDMVFGLKTRRSPLDKTDCTPARVVHTRIRYDYENVLYDPDAGGGASESKAPWVFLGIGALVVVGGGYYAWSKDRS